jgi:hypothetical protein
VKIRTSGLQGGGFKRGRGGGGLECNTSTEREKVAVEEGEECRI